MYILGISCFYHDSAATLLKDGKIVAAAEEERFSRIKHDNAFPFKAVEYCLKSQNITIQDIAYVSFYEKPFLKFERLLFQYLATFPRSWRGFVKALPSWLTEKLRIPQLLKKKLKYKGEVLFMEHHLAHAASAFLPSPFKKAAVVTSDGVGEWTTTSFGVGEGTNIRLEKEIRFPNSLGLLYSTITAYLGFSVNNSEYKVMGLSAFGQVNTKNPYYAKLKKALDVKEDGSYALDVGYFAYQYGERMPSEKLCVLLGGPIRKPEEEVTQRHKDIAAALQMILEEVMFKILKHVHKFTKCDDLVLAGGVALNSVLNGKILKNTSFKRLWVQPNATDGGGSMGAALYSYHSILKHKNRQVLDTAYLGPAFSEKEINNFLDENEIKYTRLKEKDLVKTAAKLIIENKVIGWFQGRMEWGPRALGARSILSNPCNAHMQRILNEKVKHREWFRPFAPVVCREDAETFFEVDLPLPDSADFMLLVYPIKKQYRRQLPAVTHVDGSGRLQTVTRGQNPIYYDLIKEFGRLSKFPILINTSFNIRGEPIVCTPKDAYRCMMGTGIDCMVMGQRASGERLSKFYKIQAISVKI